MGGFWVERGWARTGALEHIATGFAQATPPGGGGEETG
jgi:hypothetical protein